MTTINFKGDFNTTNELQVSYIKDQLEYLVSTYNGNVEIDIETERDIEGLKQKIEEIVTKEFFANDEGGIEIYCDYQDELSNADIKGILQSENPWGAFNELLCEWESDYTIDYGINEILKKIKANISEAENKIFENNFELFDNFIRENFYFYYPTEHFNKRVKVNIMLDTGNMNYDFASDNVLNWYGRYGNGYFDKESSLLWLAKQQCKANLLKKSIKESWVKWENDEQAYKETTGCKDKFVISAMQELANFGSNMGTMVFLVEMKLFDLFNIMEAMQKESDLNNAYELENRKGNGYIILDKSTMCGLFDFYQGGGSLLEIECERDIEIPIKCIYDAVVDGTKIYGYDIDEVYGLVDSCWRDTLKEIHPMEM